MFQVRTLSDKIVSAVRIRHPVPFIIPAGGGYVELDGQFAFPSSLYNNKERDSFINNLHIRDVTQCRESQKNEENSEDGLVPHCFDRRS